MRTRSSSRALLVGALVVLLLLSLVLAWVVPYSATDDWQWGMEEGIRWWLGGLLNGRYAGNLCAILMCRSQWGKLLIMGGCIFALPLLMALLAARGDEARLLPLLMACSGGILLMPPIMWIETYGWVSGFGNYVISTVVFLGWLLALRRVADKPGKPAAWALLLFPLTLIMGLFVENLTLLFLGACVILAGYALWDRRLFLPFWACLLGAGAAVFFMFFNGLFQDLAQSGQALNGLRNLSFSREDGLLGILTGVALQYFVSLLPISFLRGVHMALPMAVITGFGFWNSKLRPLCLTALIPLLYNVHVMRTESFRTPAGVVLSCICWALPLLALLVQEDNGKTRLRRVLLYLSAPLSLLPMAATTTLGQRLYFFPMVMLILVAADVAIPLLKTRPGTLLAAALLMGLCLYWGNMYRCVHGCTLVRQELIQQVIEEEGDTLVLPTDRYQRIAWATLNPWNAEYASYFRRYYHVPEDVALVFLPAGSYELWPHVPQEMWDKALRLEPFQDFTPSLP